MNRSPSEIDDDGWETRRVQYYRDGRCEWTDGSNETASIGLSNQPYLSVDEISRQSEFDAAVIGREEFEKAWTRAFLGESEEGTAGE